MDVRNQDSYFQSLQALLPVGYAWNKDRDSVISAILYALAAELARHDNRANQLLNEADPFTTVEMISEWEKWAGLPSTCMALETQTLSDRRLALIDRLTDAGGQRPQDYIDLAARFGAVITITESYARTVLDPISLPLNNQLWRFVWFVNMPLNSSNVRWRSCLDPVDQPIRFWGNKLVECIIRSRKPAHTNVLFSYPS